MRKTYNIFKKMGRKNLALSIVALVLTSVMLIGATYSWIENITAVEISNKNQTTKEFNDNLCIASDINSTIEIRNCGAVEGTPTQSKFNAIDLGEYFYKAGDMHLTTCSGKGDSFTFKTLKGSTDAAKYRIGTEDDENVNYLSATFKVSSPEAGVDFWFHEVPKVKKSNTDEEYNIAYYSFTVDGETTVYSKNGETYTHIASATGATTNVVAQKTSAYTFNDENNVNNDNVLFSVDKDETKTVTVRIWLQSTAETEEYSDVPVDIDMLISSSWAEPRTITVYDGTIDIDKENWIYNDNAKMYLALIKDGSCNNDLHWEININPDTHIGTVQIPSYYYGQNICIYRCASAGWNATATGTIPHKNVNCWNYWETTLPNGFKNQVFSFFGNTPVKYRNNSTEYNQSDTGYSTWDPLREVRVFDNNKLNHDTSKPQMISEVCVEGSTYPMAYPARWTGGYWKTFIPENATQITFRYKQNGFTYNEVSSQNWKSSTDKCYYNEPNVDNVWGFRTGDTNTSEVRPVECFDYVIFAKESGNGDWIQGEDTSSSFYIRGEGFENLTWNVGVQMTRESNNTYYAVLNYKKGDSTNNLGYSSPTDYNAEFKIINTVEKDGKAQWYGNNTNTFDFSAKSSTDNADAYLPNSTDVGGLDNNCKIKLGKPGSYLFCFEYDSNNDKGHLTINYIPPFAKDGFAYCYSILEKDHDDSFKLKNMYCWNTYSGAAHVQGDFPVGYLREDLDYGSRKHKVFITELDCDTTSIKWHGDGGYLPTSDDGFVIQKYGYDNKPDYQLAYEYNNSSSKCDIYWPSKRQTVEKPKVKKDGAEVTEITIGDTVTLSANVMNNGPLDYKKSAFYYVQYGEDSPVLVDSTWTPSLTGTYTIYARGSDGYIGTNLSDSTTLTVKVKS